MNEKPTFAVHVVGCKVNQVEAAMLSNQLKEAGWLVCDESLNPDLVLVHTCTVTQRADRDSKKYIIHARKKNPGVAIAVSGCLAELEQEQLQKIPGVIAVIKQGERAKAAKLIQQALSIARMTGKVAASAQQDPVNQGFFLHDNVAPLPGRSRAYLKIEDGCDGECTYCRVRLARGKPVSRPVNDIIHEAAALIRRGFHEIVLTGVNIGCWQPGLPKLLMELMKLPGRYRFRLSSIEPQHLSDALINAMVQSGDKFCPHLHIPIQSGDDSVLQAMGRTYTAGQLQSQVTKLRLAIPHIAITGDVIVGFPGETPEAFENSCQFIRECSMIKLHVFPFSARPGTAAAAFPEQVQTREITRRARALRGISRKLTRAAWQARLGRKTQVLLEKKEAPGLWRGTTETYDRALIEIPGKAGQLTEGTIYGCRDDLLLVKP